MTISRPVALRDEPVWEAGEAGGVIILTGAGELPRRSLGNR
jgi:hypothetical protein